jgi:hypothetical protein
MRRNRTAVFATVMMLLKFSVTSIMAEVVAQREMVPEWTYEDKGWFTRVAVSADGNIVGAGTNDTGKFYLFRNGTLLWNYSVGSVHSISMSSDGKYIAVGAGSDFYLFNRENSSSPLLKYSIDYNASIVAISSDGKYAVAGAMPNASQQDAESEIYVFERGQSQPSWTKPLPGVLESLSLSSNGDYFVASTSLPGVMYVFSREQEAPLWSYSFGERSGGVKISSDGGYVVATGGNQSDRYSKRIFLFHQQNSTPRYMKIIPELPSRWCVSVSSKGLIFAISYTSRNNLVLFNMNVRPYSSRSIQNVSLPENGCSLYMSLDSRYIFVGTPNGMFAYEYLNNELMLKSQYTTNSSIIHGVACSSDGKGVVAVGKPFFSSNDRSQIYFFKIEDTVNPWVQLTPIVIGVIVVVVGIAGFIFYRRIRGK